MIGGDLNSWSGFDFADRCSNRFLSRRDYRTQPGVLTPGTDKKGTRPECGGREAFSALNAERDPQRISAALFLLRPLIPELRRTGRDKEWYAVSKLRVLRVFVVKFYSAFHYRVFGYVRNLAY